MRILPWGMVIICLLGLHQVSQAATVLPPSPEVPYKRPLRFAELCRTMQQLFGYDPRELGIRALPKLPDTWTPGSTDAKLLQPYRQMAEQVLTVGLQMQAKAPERQRWSLKLGSLAETRTQLESVRVLQAARPQTSKRNKQKPSQKKQAPANSTASSIPTKTELSHELLSSHHKHEQFARIIPEARPAKGADIAMRTRISHLPSVGRYRLLIRACSRLKEIGAHGTISLSSQSFQHLGQQLAPQAIQAQWTLHEFPILALRDQAVTIDWQISTSGASGELLISDVMLEGTVHHFPTSTWPSPLQAQWFGANMRTRAWKEWLPGLKTFTLDLWRRPPTSKEIQALQGYHDAHQAISGIQLRQCLVELIASPQFLYLDNLHVGQGEMTHHHLLSRSCFFLNGTPPTPTMRKGLPFSISSLTRLPYPTLKKTCRYASEHHALPVINQFINAQMASNDLRNVQQRPNPETTTAEPDPAIRASLHSEYWQWWRNLLSSTNKTSLWSTRSLIPPNLRKFYRLPLQGRIDHLRPSGLALTGGFIALASHSGDSNTELPTARGRYIDDTLYGGHFAQQHGPEIYKELGKLHTGFDHWGRPITGSNANITGHIGKQAFTNRDRLIDILRKYDRIALDQLSTQLHAYAGVKADDRFASKTNARTPIDKTLASLLMHCHPDILSKISSDGKKKGKGQGKGKGKGEGKGKDRRKKKQKTNKEN